MISETPLVQQASYIILKCLLLLSKYKKPLTTATYTLKFPKRSRYALNFKT